MQGLHTQAVRLLLVELLEVLVMLGGAPHPTTVRVLAQPENQVESRREGHAGDRRDFLRHQVADRGEGQHQEDQCHPDRPVNVPDPNIEWDFVFARPRRLKRRMSIDIDMKTKLQTTPNA